MSTSPTSWGRLLDRVLTPLSKGMTVIWLWWFLASQGLTLKTGQILVCDAFLLKGDLVVVQRQGVRYSLQRELVNWDIPIKTIEKSPVPQKLLETTVAETLRQHELPTKDFIIEKLEVKAASLIDVLRLIADQVGFNLIIDQGVPDTQVTFSFKQIRWQEALAVLLRSQNLSFEYRNQLLQVGPFTRYDGSIE